MESTKIYLNLAKDVTLHADTTSILIYYIHYLFHCMKKCRQHAILGHENVRNRDITYIYIYDFLAIFYFDCAFKTRF